MIWIARHSPRRNSARLHRIRTRRLTVGRLPRQHKNRHTDQSRRVFGCDRSCRSSKSSDEPIEIRAPARMTASPGARSETDSTCSPASSRKPAMIIGHAVTSDGPDGQPWPPPDSNTLWAVVRRADGRTPWRAIQLAEVRSAAPGFCNFPKAATEMKGSRYDTR